MQRDVYQLILLICGNFILLFGLTGCNSLNATVSPSSITDSFSTPKATPIPTAINVATSENEVTTSTKLIITPTILPLTRLSIVTTPTLTSLTPTPSWHSQSCLPKLPQSASLPLQINEVVEQAEASGKLPTEGKAAQYSFSYDKRFLFVQWLYSPDDRYLLAYNITDNSVEPIARLEGWWTPSPVSDCIILFGQTQKEAETGSTPSKHKTIIIDSQGNRYWFQIKKEQWQPDWGISRFAWSPDGLQIAFNFAPNRLTNEGVYIVQIDGSDIRSLFPNSEGEYFEVEEMAWSPVGDQLAIVARYNNDKTNKISKGMFIIDVQTGKRSLVVEKIQLGAYWSFDGQYLYFDAIGKSDGIGRCQQLDMLTKEIIEVDRSLCTIFAHGGIKH